MKTLLNRLRRPSERGHVLLLIAFLLTAVTPVRGTAQALAFGDPEADYFRLLQVAGVAGLDRSLTLGALPGAEDIESSIGTTAHPWSAMPWTPGLRLLGSEVEFGAVDPRIRTFLNSAAPHGQNDGPVWQGKGLTTALDAGLFARWRGLSAQFRPVWFGTQNQDFDYVPAPERAANEFQNPWYHRAVDLPQRFGDDAYTRLDLGESFIRADWGAARFEAGTGSLWWGPARLNPILLSNNAGGFPHVSVSTNRPVDIGIGRMEFEWVFGTLQQSEWATPLEREGRYMTGLTLTYSPKWLPELSLGGARVFMAQTPEDGIDAGEVFLFFQTPLKGSLEPDSLGNRNDERDQLASLFVRWVLPESGFEFFAEWARNDHASDLRDFLMEPEHSQVYTLGLQKVIRSSQDRWTRLWFELTHLERPATREYRTGLGIYLHHRVNQGYTQRGQILGAGLGPGGNAASIGFDVFYPWGKVGLYAAREARFNDVEKGKRNEYGVICCRNIHLPVEADLLLRRGAYDLAFTAGLKHELSVLRENTGDRTNLRASASVRWRLARSGR